MRSRIILIILAFALSTFFLAGCTDKTVDNPIRPQIPEQGYVNWINPWQYFSITFSTAFDPGYLHWRGYTPPGFDAGGAGGEPFPVLYFLSPFRGDERHYFEHGLAEVADRLLAQGRIQPMILVCIDGRSQLGGSFYADSPNQGKYFSAFVEDESQYVDIFNDPEGRYVGSGQDYRGPWTFNTWAMIPRLDEWYKTIDNPNSRAICGIGMGGYGAFALATKTNLFGSVSAINAPLDFDGNGSGGFLTLLNEVLPAKWTRIDTTATGRVDTTNTVDTSLTDPALSLIVSAAAAFSSHYTDVAIDSVYVRERDSVLTWSFTVLDTLTDDLRSYLPNHQAHVPYDSFRVRNDFIWGLWMENNIQNIYEANADGYASHFDQMGKLLIWSKDAKFHYDEQMTAFAQFLANKNDTNYTVMDFSGNGTLPGTADLFLYDLLEDVLVFHSRQFEKPLQVTLGATQVSNSPVDPVGTGSTVISTLFAQTDEPSAGVFSVTLKLRLPNNSDEIVLVNNQPHGSGGLTITDNGDGTYMASYTYDPDDAQTSGLYDLYFEVTDGTDIVVDGFYNNLDELEIGSPGK